MWAIKVIAAELIIEKVHFGILHLIWHNMLMHISYYVTISPNLIK